MRFRKSARPVSLWVLQILVCVLFVMTGVGKFRGTFWVAAFARWGYPDGFRVVIGVVEIIAGALLAFPWTASYAAALIVCIMIGAEGTLILHHERLAPPIVWIVIVTIIGIGRRQRAWRPSARGTSPALDPV